MTRLFAVGGLVVLAMAGCFGDDAAAPPDAAPVAGKAKFYAYAVAEHDNALHVIDTSTDTVIFTVTHPDMIRPHRSWVHPSQQRLYVSTKQGGHLLAFDISDPTIPPPVVANVRVGPADLHNIQMTGASETDVDGLVWVTHAGNAMEPANVSVFTANDLTPVAKITGGLTSAHGLHVRPNSREMWVTDRPNLPYGGVVRIDVPTMQSVTQPVTTLPTLSQPYDQPNNVAFTADGSVAYVVNQGDDAFTNITHDVTLIDTTSFTVLGQLSLDPLRGARPHSIEFDPVHDWMWICSRSGGNVIVVDTKSVPKPRVIVYIPVGPECHDVTLTPDHKYAYASTQGGAGVGNPGGSGTGSQDAIQVIDVSTLQVVKTIPVPSHAVVFRTP